MTTSVSSVEAQAQYEYIAELEGQVAELERRVAELEHPETSGLTEVVSEAEAEVIEMAEGILGRGLTPIEAYLMGKMLQGYKLQRVKDLLVMARFKKDPIRYAYALYLRNIKGKPASPRDDAVQEVTYWMMPEGYDPWA